MERLSYDEWVDITSLGSRYEERMEVHTGKRQHRLHHGQRFGHPAEQSQVEYPWLDGPAPDGTPVKTPVEAVPKYKQPQPSGLHDLIVEDMTLILARGIYANQALRAARFTGKDARTWDELAPGQQAMAIEDARAGLCNLLVRHRLIQE